MLPPCPCCLAFDGCVALDRIRAIDRASAVPGGDRQDVAVVATVVVDNTARRGDRRNLLIEKRLRRPSSTVEHSFRKAEVQSSNLWVGLPHSSRGPPRRPPAAPLESASFPFTNRPAIRRRPGSPFRNGFVSESAACCRASRSESAGESGNSLSSRDADAQATGPLAARTAF